MFSLVFLTTLCVYFVLSAEVCHPPYGCFTSDFPFNYAFVQLPQSPRYVGTKFLYYSQQNPSNPDVFDPLAIKYPAGFNANKSTVMFIHGYIESRETWYVPMFIEELLKKEDMNVIFCDWSNGSKFPYHQAVGNARLVGRQMVHLIEVIKNETGLEWSKLHLVGFSLGAHVVGYVGRDFKKKGLTVPRITGLDPAGPYFEYEHPDVRLDETDADFVDIIHTDTKTLFINGFGTIQESGHLDFFPNGGYHQIGCGKVDIGTIQYFACSHYRAFRYFIESINSNCSFYGYPCTNYQDFTDNKCSKCPLNGCPLMGYHAKKPEKKSKEKFYLQTRNEFPYCGYHYKATFHTATSYFAGFDGAVNLQLIGDKSREQINLPSRYYASGSIESHLVLIKTDIGNLVNVTVKHGALFDTWHLIGVVIKPMWLNDESTACYNRWLNNRHNEVALNNSAGLKNCTGR